MHKMQVLSLGWEDPLEEEMATHSNILARKIPWIKEPGGLQESDTILVTKQQLVNMQEFPHRACFKWPYACSFT